MKLGAVDEVNVSAPRECRRVVGEATGRHDEATGCATRGHDAIEFADHIDADLESAPLLALDEEFLGALGEHQIDAAIGSTAAGFRNPIALKSESFTDKLLELPPTHAVEHAGSAAPANFGHQLPAFIPAPGRNASASEADQRQDVLTDAGQGSPQRLGHYFAHLAWLRDRWHGLARPVVQQQVGANRQKSTRPPGHQ